MRSTYKYDLPAAPVVEVRIRILLGLILLRVYVGLGVVAYSFNLSTQETRANDLTQDQLG